VHIVNRIKEIESKKAPSDRSSKQLELKAEQGIWLRARGARSN